MEVHVLDSQRNLIADGIPYDLLQWNRRYYEAGDFLIQVPISLYDSSWAYIATPERPELGIIQKKMDYGLDGIILAGFFAEKMLDDKVCYPRYIGDAQKTETAVRDIFSRYKKDLPIGLAPANNPLLGDRTQSDFSDDALGTKLYSILESREMTYSVDYDFISNTLSLKVWQGVDRTQSQSENSWQTFSMEFGNLLGRQFNFDDSDSKNYAIIPANADDNGKEQQTYYLDWTNGGYKKELTIDMRASKPEEGQSMSEFKDGLLQEATEKLMLHMPIEEIDIDVTDSGYMQDYDIGDKCDIIITDVGIKVESRITQVNETVDAEGHSITIGLGNRRIDNIRRVSI